MTAVPAIRLLGPLEASGVNGHAALGGAKQRQVLAHLALADGRVVPSDRLVDAIWGETAADNARRTLQVYVSTLRKALNGAGIEGETLVREGDGYRLALALEQLDHVVFTRLLEGGQHRLADGDPVGASEALKGALELWRGPALGDLADESALAGDAQRLEELRLICTEARVDADLGLGRHAELVPEIEQLVAQHPLREHLRGQLMLALYRSGRQAEALEAYQDTRRVLVDELGLDPTSEVQTLHAKILNHDPELSAPGRQSVAALPAKLPAPSTSFIGRETELREIVERVKRGARLVTLTGPGGTGKTRLSIEAASMLVSDFKAGVHWVGLASLRDPALVVQTIAHTIGARDGLTDHIGEDELLLILDNLEQVIEVAPELSALLQACPNLTLMATSRELLRIQGEVEYAVPPLVEPEATRLFCARAQVESSPEINELCLRLEGLPLAIELAAARMAVLSPSQLLARVSQRLDLLKGGRDAHPRQETLRATIEWSYELLAPPEQQLFARLSIFGGGCTLEAAEEVAHAELDTLQSLGEKSLLRFSTERYSMLETIREYAALKLDETEQRDELAARHASWYGSLADQAELELEGSKAEAWLARLDAEIDNIRGAAAWALNNDAELVISLVGSIWSFWYQTGRAVEASHLINAAAVDELPDHVRVRALRVRASAANARNDFTEGMVLAREQLEVARRLNDRGVEAIALLQFANGAFMAGDVPAARAAYEEGLAIYRADGESSGLATALGRLGRLERDIGNNSESRALLTECLSIARDVNKPFLVAWTAKELGMTAIAAGHHDEARAYLIESFQIVDRLGLVVVGGDLVFAASYLSAALGRFLDGALLLGAADVIDERQGFEHKPELRWWWALRGDVLEALGAAEFEQAFAEGRSLGYEEALKRAQVVIGGRNGNVVKPRQDDSEGPRILH